MWRINRDFLVFLALCTSLVKVKYGFVLKGVENSTTISTTNNGIETNVSSESSTTPTEVSTEFSTLLTINNVYESVENSTTISTTNNGIEANVSSESSTTPTEVSTEFSTILTIKNAYESTSILTTESSENLTDATYYEAVLCPPGSVPCNPWQCARLEQMCDGIIHCYNSVDEINCKNYSCRIHGDFKCEKGRHKCIRAKNVCDGNYDCKDETDEKGCYKRCLEEDRFICHDNKSCIPQRKVCDGYNNCEDGSDEKNCQAFDCKNGQKVDYLSRCNAQYSGCKDNSDHMNCTDGCVGASFFCELEKSCIKMTEVCDGINHCIDGSDEIHCDNDCDLYEFYCDNERCIDVEKRCDGEDDCGDESDERNCREACSEFECHNKECISFEKYCDGFSDCSDSSDEKYCPNYRESVCNPNPCPTNAICTPGHNNTGKARPICECPIKYQLLNGHCVPAECTEHTDCTDTHVCSDYHCVDTCTGNICGENAKCVAKYHRAVCTCLDGYFGNPISGCKLTNMSCEPSPCGPNSECRVVNQQAVCSCRSQYIGWPPNCRAECQISRDCPLSMACINEKCMDPCEFGACGMNASCKVINHNPVCFCPKSTTGDPFIRCTYIDEQNACGPYYCGKNSQCSVGNKVCSCKEGYIGDPLVSCQPECTNDADCSATKACQPPKCIDPCKYHQCGINAICEVLDHEAFCRCPNRLTGNPKVYCRRNFPHFPHFSNRHRHHLRPYSRRHHTSLFHI